MPDYDPFADGQFAPVTADQLPPTLPRSNAPDAPPAPYDPFADGTLKPMPLKEAVAQAPAADPDAVRQKLASGGAPSFDEAKLLYDDEDKKGWLPNLSDIGEGIKGVASTAWEGLKEYPKAFGTMRGGVSSVEAGARGTYRLADMVRRAYNKATDFAGEQLTGATRDQKIEHFRQRLISNQAYDQRAQGNMLPAAITDKYPPYQKLAEAGSLVMDPVSIASMGTAGLPEAAAKAVAARLLAKAPMLAKAADLAIQAANVPGKVLAKVPGAVETAGRGLKNVAGLPEHVIESLVEQHVPQGLQDLARKGIHSAGPTAMALTAAGHGGPIAATAAALKAGQAVGMGMEQAGNFARRLVELSEPGQVPALLNLAKDATAPDWMRSLAGVLHKTGMGTAAETAATVAKGAMHGAAMGTALGTATAETQAERGQAIGAGVALGAGGALAGHALSGKARMIQDRLGDLAAFYVHLKEQGTPDHVIQKIKDSEALIASQFTGHPAMQGATAKAVFGEKLNFKFLERNDYAKATEGDPNTAAFFDGNSNSIVVNVDANRDAITHELAHAIAKGVGADGQSRLTIDSVFGPAELANLGRQYAARLVDGELRGSGRLLPAPGSPELTQLVEQKVASLNQRHNGDSWLYNEIYAEAGFGGMVGKDLNRAVLNRPLWDQFRQGVREKVFGDMGLSTDLPRGALFADAKVYGPEMQKMVMEHFRQIYREGARGMAASKETKEGVPAATPVPLELYGKHPAVPVGTDGVVIDNGTLRQATVREVNQRVQARQQAVKGLVEKLPEQPKTSLKPEVSPRITPEGGREVSGTRFADQLAALPQFSDEAKRTAKLMEGAFGSGNVFELWYQAIGRGAAWAGDVRRRLGNVAVSQIKFAPFKWKVSNEGNVLVEGLSLAAAQRKLAAWTDDHNSFLHTFWNGDHKAFMGDLLTYLRNHAEGRPGVEGLDDKRRDALNTFVIGKNVKFADLNPFREGLRGDDKKGIIRSLRLDRMANPQPVPDAGWFAEYQKKVHNLSPENAPQFSPDESQEQGSFGMRTGNPLKNRLAPPAAAPSPIRLPPKPGQNLPPLGMEPAYGMPPGESDRTQFPGAMEPFPEPASKPAAARKPAANAPKAPLPYAPDSATGLPSFYQMGHVTPEQAQATIAAKGTSQTARNLLVAILRGEAETAGKPFDPVSTDHELAKDSNQPQFERAVNFARDLITASDANFAEYFADPNFPLEVLEAAQAARAALPILPDDAPLFRFLATRGREEANRFKLLADASEGPVILDRETDFVYKAQKPSFFLNDIQPKNPLAAAKNHILDTKLPAGFFDIINKIDRQSRIQGGLPVEIQGIRGDHLILKMPRLERDATAMEVKDWLKENRADSRVKSEGSARGRITYDPVTRNQPILRDQSGNSYAAADVRQGQKRDIYGRMVNTGYYPNFMVDANGRTFMTDVMLRPIDAADVMKHPALARYAPKQPDKILYSPDKADERNPNHQYWVHKSGRVLAAPESHEATASDHILPKSWKAPTDDVLSDVYDEVTRRGWYRVTTDPSERNNILYVNGSTEGDLQIPRAARKAIEDLAFKTGRKVWYNGRETEIGPDAGEAQYSPDVAEQQPDIFAAGPGNEREELRGVRRKAAQLREAHPEAVPATVNKGNRQIEKVSYDLADAPIVKRSGEERAVAVTGARMAREVAGHISDPEIAAAKGWYDRTQTKLQSIFGAGADMLGQLLAATSARTGVRDNFKIATEALRLYSAGHYDDLLSRFADFIDKGGKLRDWTEIPRKENGQKFNANSKQVLKVLATMWAEKAGRKTKQFYQNLTGADDNATIDVWAARGLRRLLYQGEIEKWRLLPVQEKSVSSRDFSFAQKVFAEAGKKLNLAPEDVQSLMWFIEKGLWDKKHWTRGTGAEKSSFDAELNKMMGIPEHGEMSQIVKEGTPTPYRVQAGVTTHTTGEFKDRDFEASRLVLLRTMRRTKGLMAARVSRSYGLYGTDREHSYDLEGTFRHPQAVDDLERKVYEIGQAKGQNDVHVSVVVDPSHPNARPGVEVMFRRPLTLEQAQPILDTFEQAGVFGFTAAMDARGRAIGLRSQYIPEYAALFDGGIADEAERMATHLDPLKFKENAAHWWSRVHAAVEKLDKKLVSSAERYHYDTRTFRAGEAYSPRSLRGAEGGARGMEQELARRAAALLRRNGGPEQAAGGAPAKE